MVTEDSFCLSLSVSLSLSLSYAASSRHTHTRQRRFLIIAALLLFNVGALLWPRAGTGQGATVGRHV
jgi:hypothetical protein